MSDTENHQGFTNYSTWAAKLWIDNDYPTYQRVREIVAGLVTRPAPVGLLRNKLHSLLSQDREFRRHHSQVEPSLINWQEIAEDVWEDVQETDPDLFEMMPRPDEDIGDFLEDEDWKELEG